MPEQIQHTPGILDMLSGSSPVVQGVLVILIILSLWSWALVIGKSLHFKKIKAASKSFSDIFWQEKSLARVDSAATRFGDSPLASVFTAGYRELNHILQDAKDYPADPKHKLEILEQSLVRAEREQTLELESGLTFLATVASAAPFIGLFGTVWGIMNAFTGLSSASNTTLQAVAPGISEALIATAVGLAAAIPAAIAYNFLSAAIKNIRGATIGFCNEFLSIAKSMIR